MRNYIETVLRCARCGNPLEIKLEHEISESVKGHKFDYIDGTRTGASKIMNSIFVETCKYCQEEIERPARMIRDGIKLITAAGESEVK